MCCPGGRGDHGERHRGGVSVALRSSVVPGTPVAVSEVELQWDSQFAVCGYSPGSRNSGWTSREIPASVAETANFQVRATPQRGLVQGSTCLCVCVCVCVEIGAPPLPLSFWLPLKTTPKRSTPKSKSYPHVGFSFVGQSWGLFYINCSV